jgi:hypothetical protein
MLEEGLKPDVRRGGQKWVPSRKSKADLFEGIQKWIPSRGIVSSDDRSSSLINDHEMMI